jgi:hypothetical protein
MSAFDSAMLMIDDLARKNIELEQHVWDLQLSIWHRMRSIDDGFCTMTKECVYCKTGWKAFYHVESMINED